MSDVDWAVAEADRLRKAASSYEDQAFYAELGSFFRELAHRQALAAAELDGRAWDHANW